MAANTRTTVFSVKEAYVYPLLRDVEGELPLFGRGIKCPAIQTVSLSENLTTVNCPGDGTNVDSQSEIDSVELSIEHGQLDHVLNAIVKGGLHRLLPTESQYIFGGSDQGNQFCLAVRATKLGAPGCDYVLRVWKLVAGTSSKNIANKEFKQNTFDATASQVQGRILHANGNDWYLEQVRNTSTNIDPASPYPTLPSAYTALTVASTSVEEGDDDFVASASPSITFSAAVADEYVNGNYFYIVDRVTGQMVPAVVSQATATVTVNPDTNLTAGRKYSLVALRSVASAATRVALGTTLVINFQVAA